MNYVLACWIYLEDVRCWQIWVGDVRAGFSSLLTHNQTIAAFSGGEIWQKNILWFRENVSIICHGLLWSVLTNSSQSNVWGKHLKRRRRSQLPRKVKKIKVLWCQWGWREVGRFGRFRILNWLRCVMNCFWGMESEMMAGNLSWTASGHHMTHCKYYTYCKAFC